MYSNIKFKFYFNPEPLHKIIKLFESYNGLNFECSILCLTRINKNIKLKFKYRGTL